MARGRLLLAAGGRQPIALFGGTELALEFIELREFVRSGERRRPQNEQNKREPVAARRHTPVSSAYQGVGLSSAGAPVWLHRLATPKSKNPLKHGVSLGTVDAIAKRWLNPSFKEPFPCELYW